MDRFDQIARFYDGDYRNYDDDLGLIVELAQDCDGSVLELGCGTGRVIVPLAQSGLNVTGIDASHGLIEQARAKLAQLQLQEQVELVDADLRTFDLPARDFAFAVCTSNTLMHFTTPADQMAVLTRACRHLRPDGLLFIDLFNPDIARLLQVDGLTELADRWEAGDVQVLKWSVRTLDLARQLQETLFIYEEVFADGRTQRTLCPFTLRFLWRNEAELMLTQAGFTVVEVWGDFDAAPYEGQSEHLILLARKRRAS